MIVTTRDKDLQMVLDNAPRMQKVFGPKRAKYLLKRVAKLLQAKTLEDVRNEPGHFHELVEDRKGQWACDLDQPYRLIFEPHEDPIPTDSNGKYIWNEIKGVELIEVTNYHGK